MTRLSPDKPLVRETDAFDRSDRFIVELHPKRIHVRLKGKRAGFDVPYDAVYDLGKRLAFRRSA